MDILATGGLQLPDKACVSKIVEITAVEKRSLGQLE